MNLFVMIKNGKHDGVNASLNSLNAQKYFLAVTP
jgi:hypothetical protein